MLTLLIGENTHEKLSLIADLKAPWAANSEALQFDTQTLYGQKLEAKELKKALLTLPAILKQRLIFVREAEKLDEHSQTVLLDFISSKPSHAVVILDCLSLPAGGNWAQIRKMAKVHESVKTVKENVFDMTKKMTLGRTSEALQSLHQLYDDGAYPLQIMGGIVWAWGQQRGRVPAEKFEQGLRDLQEADLNIKRSRLVPEEALEVLVVKLAGLKR